MKKLILLLLAFLAVAASIPTARAGDDDIWRNVKKSLGQLNNRMGQVYANRQRYGASYRMRRQIADVEAGIQALGERYGRRAGGAKTARDLAARLSGQLSVIETEYVDRARARGGRVVITINR